MGVTAEPLVFPTSALVSLVEPTIQTKHLKKVTNLSPTISHASCCTHHRWLS